MAAAVHQSIGVGSLIHRIKSVIMQGSFQPLSCLQNSAGHLCSDRPIAQVEGIESPEAQEVLLRLGPEIIAAVSVIDRVMKESLISPEHYASTKDAAIHEFGRRAADFMQLASIFALMSFFRNRSVGRSVKEGKSLTDAEDRGQKLAMKINKAINGNWPTGNVGAWVSTIDRNAGHDDGRKEAVEQKLGVQYDSDVVVAVAQEDDPAVDEEVTMDDLKQTVATLPQILQDIAWRLMAGETLPEIAAALDLPVKDIYRMIQRSRLCR